MKNVILISPPAGGKGTQSDLLKNTYNYEHISAGVLLRNFAEGDSVLAQQTKNIMDQGLLVHDETTVSLIDEELKRISGKPFVLDGFPRNTEQARKFSIILNKNNITNYAVIYLKLDENTALSRALGRVNCECGKIYNIFLPDLQPKVENICDSCGRALDKRSDDNIESFKTRFNLYLENVDKLINYYENELNIKVHQVDSSREPLVIFEEIKEIVND